MPEWLADLQAQFQLNFIEKDRWRSLLTGLGNTMKITLFAALLGVAIGIVIAAVRSTYDNNKEDLKHKKSIGYYILGFFNAICKIYLTVIRGTPVVVQLLIIYFVIFASSTNDIMIATLAFGINSGAYVAEILRGGIMSIDKGQFEAGRSIGFNYFQTMFYIIIPQVLKNVRVHSKPEALNDEHVQLAVKNVADALGDRGRILVRESGTEPVIRVMVEADTEEICEKYVDYVIQVIKAKGHVAE